MALDFCSHRPITYLAAVKTVRWVVLKRDLYRKQWAFQKAGSPCKGIFIYASHGVRQKKHVTYRSYKPMHRMGRCSASHIDSPGLLTSRAMDVSPALAFSVWDILPALVLVSSHGSESCGLAVHVPLCLHKPALWLPFPVQSALGWDLTQYCTDQKTMKNGWL